MFFKTVTVFMVVGLLVASFVAGQRSVAKADVPYQAKETIPVMTSSSGDYTAVMSQSSELPLSKKIIFANIAARNAIGGGEVQSVTSGIINGTSVWDIHLINQGHHWNVKITKTRNKVLQKIQIN